MLQINLTSFERGLHTLTLEPTAAALDLDPTVFSGICVDVRMDYAGERVLVAMEAGATARLTCDRTLVPFDQDVSGSCSLLFTSVITADDEEAYEDMRLLPADQRLDLTEAVRDTLLLALPVRRVAPGAEDVELPTRFGTPTNPEDDIDPRWAALRALKNGGPADG